MSARRADIRAQAIPRSDFLMPPHSNFVVKTLNPYRDRQVRCLRVKMKRTTIASLFRSLLERGASAESTAVTFTPSKQLEYDIVATFKDGQQFGMLVAPIDQWDTRKTRPSSS
jgi:hypothetical protein